MYKLKRYSSTFCTLLVLFSVKNACAQKPIISGFSPTKGNIGSTVIISGSNFSATATNNFVYFGDVKATVLSATSSTITVVVPAGVSYKPISVTVNGLTAYSSIPFTVTFPGDGNNFTANSFSAKMDSSWGFPATNMGATDLDGDGDLDPVVVSFFSNSIYVLKNNSSIGSISLSYSPSSNFATSASPVSISFGDLDGDSKQDIIVTSYTNGLSIFKNNSTTDSIGLLPKIDLVTGNSPFFGTIADIDNDGKPDIVCTNSGSNSISIFRNTSTSGTISFAPKVDFTTGNDPYGLSITDLDGDGLVEVIVANEDDFSISIFKNNSSPGNISFGGQTNISNVFPSILKTADLDGDGKPDIIATRSNSASIAVLRNTSSSGSLSFASLQLLPTGFGNPTYLNIGDIDGDGKPDIAVNHENYTTVSIIKNLSQPGTISFSSNTDFNAASMPLTVLLTDLDNDARPDIISGSGSGTAFSIFRNLVPKPFINSFAPATGGNGTVVTITGNNFNTTSQIMFGGAPASSFIVQSSTTILAVADTGSTGDVTVTTAYGVSKRSGFIFSKTPTITSFTPTQGGTGTLVTINGTNFNNTTAVNFGNVAATSFTVVSPTTISATVGSIPPGNFDVSVTNASGNASLGNFYTGVTISSFYPGSGPVGTIVTINGTHFSSNPPDNIVYFGSVRATVLIATQTSLTVSVPPGSTYQPITVTVNNLTAYSIEPFTVTFKGTGNEFTASSFGDRVDSTAGSAGVHVSISDLNNDGKSDVIISNLASSSISVCKNTSSNGITSFQRKVDYMLDNYALSSSMGDLDGDGKFEIVAVKEQNGVSLDRSISIFKNISTTDTILLTRTDYSLGSLNDNPKFAVITDFDGDGKPDIAVLTYSSIALLRNTSTSSSISFAPKIDIVFGQVLATSIATADVDGDGKSDIIITADNAENIYIIRNISKPGQLSFAQKVVIGTGFSPKSVSLADLNNDGRPDMVAFNRGNNSVSTYKNTSTAGVVSFDNRINYQLDLVPENLALADLDGDARIDISFVNKGQFAYVIKNTSVAGNISFANKVQYDVPYLPSNVTNADMNNDGKTDIITSNFSTANNFSVLVNKCQDDGLGTAIINVSGPLTFCEGENVVLKTSSTNGAFYQWYKNGAAIATANDSILTVTTAGIYSVKITINSIVSASAPYIVSVKPLAPQPVLTVDGTGNLCQGTATLIHSSTQVGIKWYKDDILLAGITDSVYRVSTAGRYKVIATSNGCPSSFSNEVTIAINPTPVPTITASSSTFCEGDSVILNANSVVGYTYQWNINGEQLPGAISSRLASKNGGNFSITESNNGCSVTSSAITITRILSPPKPTITLNGTNLSSSALNGNQWFRDGVAINGATSQVYNATISGNYSVQVTQNGCKSAMSELRAVVITSVVFIDNTHFIRLSPNPVKDEMVLDFKLDGIYQLNIDLLDLNGRLLKRWKDQQQGSRLYISNYARSVYIARVYSANGKIMAVLKLIRQ
jgi:FG-GAP-like repeat/IPT/TIG domain